MNFQNSKHFARFEPSLEFVAIFEECTDYRKIYKLPFNTLVGILDAGEGEPSTMEDCNTHEVRVQRRNDLFFTPVNQPVLYTLHSPRVIAVHFNLNACPGLDIYQESRNWIWESAPGEVAELERAFRIPDRLHSLSCLREFCLRFCNRHWPETPDPGSQGKRMRYEKVLAFVRAGVTAKTTVGELAEQMKMRPDVFSREFSALFQRTPKNFLEDELAAKASSLLMNSNRNVREIAAALGFSSEFYFSKFFKRRIGCPPSEYARRFH